MLAEKNNLKINYKTAAAHINGANRRLIIVNRP